MSVITKIIKNNKGITDVWAGVTLAPSETYTLSTTQYSEWAANSKVISDVQSGDLVINDGNSDLSAELGELHIKSGVVFVHEDVALLPGAGVDAPALVPINGSAVGFEMNIGDKVYGQTRVAGLVGDFVEFQVHYTIDNVDANKNIQFELSYFTTNGVNDSKAINIADGTVVIGPNVVENTPWLVREAVVEIPAFVFQNEEVYLFVGITRVDPTPLTSPTNNPVVLRYCKRYYRVDN